MTTEACFVGVGVGRYDEGHDQLDHAVTDVKAFAGLLDGVFVCTLLSNPTEQVVRDGLKALRDSLPDGGSLVLLWSGHAIPSPADGLRLLARDSGRFPTDGLGAASDVAARAPSPAPPSSWSSSTHAFRARPCQRATWPPGFWLRLRRRESTSGWGC